MDQPQTPNYYAIIPSNVRYDKRLKANEKLLFGEITALTHSNGKCWANNQYFAELYGVSKSTVSKWISNLIKFGYLKMQLIYAEGSRQIVNRYISLKTYPMDEKINTPMDKNIHTPMDENAKDNNTSINNTSINNINTITKNSFLENSGKENKDVLVILKEVSSLFPDEIIKRLSKKDKENWRKTINDLIEIDKYSKKEIITAIKHGRSGFWSDHFFSVQKLRKKNKDGIKYISVFLNQNNGNNNNNNNQTRRNSSDGYKVATVDEEKLLRELAEDAKNGNIPGVYSTFDSIRQDQTGE